MLKKLLILISTSSVVVSAYSQKLLCASKSGETLYYTDGQIRVTADIDSETELSSYEITISESDTLGVSERSVVGKKSGKYIRFEDVADAWCSYKLTVFANYLENNGGQAFLDASCEEGNKYSIKLKCAVRD